MMMPEPRRRAAAQPRKAPTKLKAAGKPRKAATSPPKKSEMAVAQRRARARRRTPPAAPPLALAAPPPSVPLRSAPRAGPVRQIIKIRRTDVADRAPTGLQEGELAVELASIPVRRLWVGVPTTIDAAGRVQLNAAVGGIGTSSFAPITAAFTVPAVGGSVTLQLEQAEWCVIGAPIFVGGMTGLITAISGNTITVTRIPGPEVTPEPDFITRAPAPLMLAAVNGAVCLTGNPPALTRIGNTVFCSYQGANKASITANTISIAEIPPGYQPTANVAQTITTPAITMNIQRYTTGTNVFPNAPGVNAGAGNTRWSLRHGTQFAANAAISLAMQWQTADPFV